jgi:hypothetical protein
MITTDTAAMISAKAQGVRLVQHEVTFSYVDEWTGEPAELHGVVWAPADTTDVEALKAAAVETYVPALTSAYSITSVARVTLAGTTVLA